jgi:hypothetical protein
MPRWKLSDLLLLVAVCGIAFAAYHLYWGPSSYRGLGGSANASAFLACLAVASLGSFFARPRWRRAFQGFAAFGWLELVFVISRYIESHANEAIIDLGLIFGVLCAIVAWWLFEPPAEGASRSVDTRPRSNETR